MKSIWYISTRNIPWKLLCTNIDIQNTNKRAPFRNPVETILKKKRYLNDYLVIIIAWEMDLQYYSILLALDKNK